MASQSDKDAAAHTRIIEHMNKDHQDSLIKYLQYYHHLSSFTSRKAYLSEIDFSSLTILLYPDSEKRYKVPISPPMTSWSDARPRVVEMDGKATAGLGKSSVTVKKFTPPQGFMVVVWAAAFLTFIAFSQRSNFRPGSWCYLWVLRYVPSFSNFCWRIQPLVFYPMVLLHTVEMVYMERSRLQRHTVRVLGRVWWLWMFSTFVEGIGAYIRFDKVVREEEQKRAKAQH